VKKLAGKPFALIGVNLAGHDPQALKAVMEREKLNWRSFADRGALSGKWHVSGTPTFYVIDPRGVIRYKWVGSPGEKALDAAIETVLEEAAPRERQEAP
jgi:peroxiredoxin